MYLHRYSTPFVPSSKKKKSGINLQYQHHRPSTSAAHPYSHHHHSHHSHSHAATLRKNSAVYKANRASTRRIKNKNNQRKTVRTSRISRNVHSKYGNYGKTKTIPTLTSPIKLFGIKPPTKQKKKSSMEQNKRGISSRKKTEKLWKERYAQYQNNNLSKTKTKTKQKKYLGSMISTIKKNKSILSNLRTDISAMSTSRSANVNLKNYAKTRRKNEDRIRRREQLKRSKLQKSKSAIRHSLKLKSTSSTKRTTKNKQKYLKKNASDLLYDQRRKNLISSHTQSHTARIEKKKGKKSKSAHMIPHQSIIGMSEHSKRSISDSQIRLRSISQLTMKDIAIKSLLGEGAFSKVFLVRFKETKNVQKNVNDKISALQIALKVIPRKNATKKRNDKESKNLMWERLVLSHLCHPFIVEYFGSFCDDKRVCFLMEFVIGGEILFHFENCRLGRFPPSVCRFYIAEIICALEYVHCQGFVYRDLKPENILLDNEGHIKLVDFGFAKRLKSDELTYTLCGSKEYVAPEVLLGNGHNGAADLWSLGCLTFEFVIGHLPFPTQDSSPYQVLDIIKSTKLIFPHYVCKIVQDFIKRLLTFDPNKRMKMDKLKKHEWFSEFNWTQCNKKQMKPPIIPSYNGLDDVKNFANARFEENDDNKYHRDEENIDAFKDLQLF